MTRAEKKLHCHGAPWSPRPRSLSSREIFRYMDSKRHVACIRRRFGTPVAPVRPHTRQSGSRADRAPRHLQRRHGLHTPDDVLPGAVSERLLPRRPTTWAASPSRRRAQHHIPVASATTSTGADSDSRELTQRGGLSRCVPLRHLEDLVHGRPARTPHPRRENGENAARRVKIGRVAIPGGLVTLVERFWRHAPFAVPAARTLPQRQELLLAARTEKRPRHHLRTQRPPTRLTVALVRLACERISVQ